MKKIVILLLVSCILFTGCEKNSKKDVMKNFIEKFEKSKGYYLKGELSINNHDEIYNYDVEVCYKKDRFYKVKLTNIANNHTQVILKNKDGVYVLTPALNKSFRFQSDWPYQNSQIYLLDAIVHDIENDKSLIFKQQDDGYLFQVKVHYSNNVKLTNQKVFLNKNFELEKVAVYDKDGIEAMTMTYEKVNYSSKFSNDEFSIDSIINQNKLDEVKETSSLEDVIYPLFVPDGTKLVEEEKISKENGERVIMNYDGEKSFLLVEETADVFQEFTVIPSSGEPYLVMDTLGVMNENSLSWTTGGIDFYLVSDVMEKDEMIEIAQSITGIVSMK